MVNKTIAALSPINGDTVVGDDLLIIADINDSNIAKKITRNQFFVNVPPLVVTGSITVEGPRDPLTETYPPSRLTLDTTGDKGKNFFYSYDVTTDGDVETPGIMTWNAESHDFFTGTTIANVASRLNLASNGSITLSGNTAITGTTVKISGVTTINGATNITGNTELLGSSKLTVGGNTELQQTSLGGNLTTTTNSISTTTGSISTTTGSISSDSGNIGTTTGKVTGGNGLVATAGGVTATKGDITATAGSITAGTSISADTSITAGNGITASAGNIVANNGKITGGTGIVATSGGVIATAGGVTASAGNIVATTGNISAPDGKVTGGTGIVATSGGVTATAGGITVTAGDLTVTAGDIAVSGTVDDRDIAKNIPDTFGAVGQVLTIKDATSVEWDSPASGGTTNNNIVDNDAPYEGVRIQAEDGDTNQGRSLLIDAVQSNLTRNGLRITTLSGTTGGANIYTTRANQEVAVMQIDSNNTRMLGNTSSFRPPQVSANNRALIDPVLPGSLVVTGGDLWINTTGTAGAASWSRVGGPGTAGAWVNFNGKGNITDVVGHNIDNVVRTPGRDRGYYDITFSSDLQISNYAVTGTSSGGLSNQQPGSVSVASNLVVLSKTKTKCSIWTNFSGREGGVYFDVDPTYVNLAFFDFTG